MKFSCKSQTKESGNVTVSVARDIVPWTAFYDNDDSGRVGYIESTCGVGGALSPSLEDYTCTRDCEAPQLDGSIMGSIFVYHTKYANFSNYKPFGTISSFQPSSRDF